MKAIQAICGTFLVLGGVLLAVLVCSAYDTKYAVLGLTDDFWTPIILLLILLSAMTLFLTFRAAVKKGGKKGGFQTAMAVLFALGAVFFAYSTVDRVMHREKYQFVEIQSPDGLHSVWRTERTDLLGNSCYVFYRQENMITYTYLFDSDRGEPPQINWQDSGLEYRGEFFSYAD